MTGNCGLPDGEVHMHSERCYEAGYADGRAAVLDELRPVVEAALRIVQPVVANALDVARRLGVKFDG